MVTLNKLGKNYASLEMIRILADGADTSDTFRKYMSVNTDTLTHTIYNNNRDKERGIEHEM
jgi:hypothetical protein